MRCKAQVRWLWVALCRRTRQVVAYVFGERSEATCRRLWERIPEDYWLALCYSDFWRTYQNVIAEEQHVPVEKGSGETNHVERWNGTLRQRLGRFVRKTLSFSKSERMHEICLRLFVHHYNLDRLHALTTNPTLTEPLPGSVCIITRTTAAPPTKPN